MDKTTPVTTTPTLTPHRTQRSSIRELDVIDSEEELTSNKTSANWHGGWGIRSLLQKDNTKR